MSDDFFDNLDFQSMRCERSELNPYSVALDECAIKGKRKFCNHDEDELMLFTKAEFIKHHQAENEDAKSFDPTRHEFIIVGDEYIEGISDPEELEDELNAWGIYL